MPGCPQGSGEGEGESEGETGVTEGEAANEGESAGEGEGTNEGEAAGEGENANEGESANEGEDAAEGEGEADLPAIVKTHIGLGISGKIAVGDDLIVYGVGDDEAAVSSNQEPGVHFIRPSESDRDTEAGTKIPGSDQVYEHRKFVVAGKKVAVVRSTNAIDIYDTETGETAQISPGDITLHTMAVDANAAGDMRSDGDLIATINDTDAVNDGNAIKVVDVSGETPVITSFANPVDTFDEPITDWDQVAIDARYGWLAALGNSDIYVWDLTNPMADPLMLDMGLNSELGSVNESIQMSIDNGYILYQDNAELDPRAGLLNVLSGTVLFFADAPVATSGPMAMDEGSYIYLLNRETADQGNEFNSYRSAIGSVLADTDSPTLASQFDRYELRDTNVNTGVAERENCIQEAKLIGYGATMCVTPDGETWYLAGWSAVDNNFDYVQRSTGGVFEDIPDPEGSSLTGSLMGTDIVCSINTVAFRGFRELTDSGCLTDGTWVLSFIRIDAEPDPLAEEGEGETEGEAPAEGEGEAPAEGEGEAPAEGEGEAPAEGEGEAPAEGEGEAPTEGEGEAPTEGEGEAPLAAADLQLAFGANQLISGVTFNEVSTAFPDAALSDVVAFDLNSNSSITLDELLYADFEQEDENGNNGLDCGTEVLQIVCGEYDGNTNGQISQAELASSIGLL